jgi:hypothetical protein
MWRQTYYNVTDENNKISFEGLDIITNKMLVL